MSLPTGGRIGPYEIIASLGAGGMGEVYRARDAKLNRDVAIKILPEAFAADAERLARFNREAQALAALNHPNITAIYGIEESRVRGSESGGEVTRALIMELVEGDDLSHRIAQGAMPLEDALPIARQIVDALEAAHEQGIIHRDLKPANIKVRADGTVKVLDFGLAKAMDPGGGSESSLSNSPTLTARATQMGMILGTAAYMAPEQAKGRAVDKRADIWAFGAVLYEMLTGHRAFGGDDVSETLASVLKDQPAIDAIHASVPPAVRQLLRRCLQKDPRQRLRDIGDVRILLDEDAGTATMVAPADTRRGGASAVPWAVAAVAVVTAAVMALPMWRSAADSQTAPVRFVIPEATTLTNPTPALAPDGSFIIYGTDRLYLRRIADFESRELPGTAHAEMPFISPDSRWVGFYVDGKIKKISVAGSEPLPIMDLESDTPGAAFVSNDRILFSAGWNQAPLMSVSADGGPVTQASTLDAGAKERGHWWPHVLPDGRHVLFTIWYAASGLSASRIGVLDLETGTHRALFPGAMATFADGHLLFYQAGQYHVAPFNPTTFELTGESAPVLPDALGLSPQGSTAKPVSTAANGTVAYWPGELNPLLTLTWVARNGQRTPTTIRLRINGAALSPDGRSVAVGRPEGGTVQVWTYDFSGGEQRLTTNGSNLSPTWHPDSRRLAYISMQKGNFDAEVRSLDGPTEFALSSDIDEELLGWLPDGRIVIREWAPDGPTSVILMEPDGSNRVPLITGAFSKDAARVSPDGRWLAICANPSGSYGLYARATTAAGGLHRLASASDDCSVQWSAKANELILDRDDQLVAVTYAERDGRLLAVRESVITTLPPGSELYGVSPDGQRFLTGIPEKSTTAPRSVHVILNGIAALASGRPKS